MKPSVALVAALALLTSHANAQVLPFQNSPTFITNGGNTLSLAVADLNGDGNADIVSANLVPQTVSIRFGNGAGAFPTSTSFPAASPFDVAIGDVDGDGDLDVVAANLDQDSVTPYFNSGAGSFTAGTPFPVGIDPIAVELVDTNADGAADLFCLNSGDSTLHLALADGLGGFGAAIVVSTGPLPSGMVVTDLDQDGAVDVACTFSGNDTVGALLTSSGMPAFTATAAVGAFPNGVAAGDFDADGDRDLAVCNQAGNTLSIVTNDGMGGFMTTATLPAANGPLAIATADLNHRYGIDIVVNHFNAGTLQLWRNDGLGGFILDHTFVSGAFPSAVIAADLDGDDNPEVVSGNTVSPDLAIFANLGSDLLYPGTNDDIDIGIGINAPPTSGTGSYLQSGGAGDAFVAHVYSPLGTYDFTPYILAAQIHYFGFPPPNAFNGAWLNQFAFGAVFLVNGYNGGPFAEVLVPGGSYHAYQIPIGLAGLDVMLQGLTLSGLASNGIVAISDGYVVRLTR